ncbi:hypothetical protein VTK73DRAFT_4660 [Phialemonium thermophilum]|uniref:Uncharacterized protein n=1 Tax=Phialemonium thermophilum TaxID=223376 RepID=A0ABR3V6Z4_9PEZI
MAATRSSVAQSLRAPSRAEVVDETRAMSTGRRKTVASRAVRLTTATTLTTAERSRGACQGDKARQQPETTIYSWVYLPLGMSLVSWFAPYFCTVRVTDAEARPSASAVTVMCRPRASPPPPEARTMTSPRPPNTARVSDANDTRLAGSPLSVATICPGPDTENVTASAAVGTR